MTEIPIRIRKQSAYSEEKRDLFTRKYDPKMRSLRTRFMDWDRKLSESGKGKGSYERTQYDRALDMLGRVMHWLDADLLLIMEKHLVDLTAVSPYMLNATSNALRAAGYTQVSTVMTEEHLRRCAKFDEALLDPSMDSVFEHSFTAWGDDKDSGTMLMRAVAITSDETTYEYVLAHPREIMSMMRERKIKKYAVLRELLQDMSSGSAALAEGTL